ncbi:MAG: YeeE/YedE family protein, partial [Deltaproteobacteria bacterium]|nr:YeeE/YedE family protein [Deltaproteobacteria bacterium]
MIFPLYGLDTLGYETGLVVYTLVGVGFGFVLERAGFGQAPNLAAQFYGTNMLVLKVMFTAIVTAAVGLVLLAGVGVLDLSHVQVPPTFLWPQLVGGLLLGVGFVISGYCPGTAVVATSSGNLDGIGTLVGVAVGSLVYGLIYPAIQ